MLLTEEYVLSLKEKKTHNIEAEIRLSADN